MKTYSIDSAIKKLNEVGIPTKKYARPPAGKHVFAIGIGDRYKKNERICIWPGLVSSVGLSVSTRAGQAAMVLYEESQEITFVASHYIGRQSYHTDASIQKEALAVAKTHPTSGANITLPDGTKFVSAEYIEEEPGWNRGYHRVRKTVKTPSAVRSFLIGKDDGDTVFISMLPTEPETLQGAFDILRPSYVPEGSKRQGEFFFLPMPEWFIRKPRSVGSYADERGTRLRSNNFMEYTDHYASECVTDSKHNEQYARGVISNSRHPDLVLEGWHFVAPNCEVPAPTHARVWD